MKKIVVRQTVTADYFEVDCNTDEVAKQLVSSGQGTLVTTRSERHWIMVGKLPEDVPGTGETIERTTRSREEHQVED